MGYSTRRDLTQSGVVWLQEKPNDWRIKRLKFSTTLINEKVSVEEVELPYIGLEHIESWTGKKISGEIASSEGLASRFSFGDVLFGKLRPYLAKVYLAQENGLISSEALVVRPSPELNAGFLKYYLLSRDFINIVDSSTYGSKMPRASWDFIGNLPILLPKIDEQQSIVRFLDFKTAQIDALIAKQQALLDKLAEKRTALISHAVTKGLDPSVPMKDSGVEWLGEIPAHWEIVRLGRKIQLQRGVDITKDEQTYGSIPVVSSGGVASYHNIAFSKGPGVIVGRKGTAGSVYFVETDFWPHDTTLWVKEFYSNLPRYVFYKLLAMDIASYDTGSANPTINRNLLHPVLVSWPPFEEQTLIADFLDRDAVSIGFQTSKIRQVIGRLHEYRSALITNAVTGKIDVRHFKTPQVHKEVSS